VEDSDQKTDSPGATADDVVERMITILQGAPRGNKQAS
jgi:hypothetical protein